MILQTVATPRVTGAFIASLFAVLGIKAATRTGLVAVPTVDPRMLTDFDAFHTVGRMVWRGDVAQAYHLPAMLRAQVEMTGRQEFLPWTYPPPFDLVAAALACLPAYAAYVVFVGLTLTAFLWVLRRIARETFPTVLALVFPALALTAACGQNGFLTGSLVGLACLGLRRGRTVAGVPLGLMVIKPHLAVALGLNVLLTRRWGCAFVAVAVAAAACGLATLLLGAAIWVAFARGVAEAGAYLAAGLYPMHRMVSVYAFLRSFEVPAALAMAAQGAVALGALAVVLLAALRLRTGQALGLTAFAGLLVSPYAYDYDLPLYGIALAFLVPDLLRSASAREQVAILLLSWFTGGYGMTLSALTAPASGPALPGGAEGQDPVSLAGLGLLALFVLVSRVMLRAARPAPASAAAPLKPIAA